MMINLLKINRIAPALTPLRRAVQPSISQTYRHSFYSTTTGEDFDSKVDNLSLDEYHKISNEYLESMVEQLDTLGDTKYKELEVDYADGVLNMDIPAIGRYCINKQPPNKQIWSSSPISGPNRYDLVKGRWISLRDGTGLTSTLENEIKQVVGDFKFDLD